MLKGIDLNSNNDVEDWQKVKNSGIQVVINKATEGNYYKDKYLNYRYPRVRAVGLKLGFYHFAGKHGPETEAQYFLDYIKDLHSDTVLFLDIEQPPTSYGWQWTKSTAVNYVSKFIAYLKAKGQQAGIYTGEYFYNMYLKGSIPAGAKLWIAKYSSVSPAGYPTNSWQYSDSGSVAGIVGHVDMDWFAEDILVSSSTKPLASKITTAPKYDTSIPTGENIYQISNMPFYIEKRTDGGMGIHLDRGNYVTLFKGKPPQFYWNDNKGNGGSKTL